MKSFRQHIEGLTRPPNDAGVDFFQSALTNAKFPEEVEALIEGIYSLISESRAGVYACQVDDGKIKVREKEIYWLIGRIVPQNRMSDKDELVSILALKTVNRLIQHHMFDFNGLEKIEILSNLCRICDSGSEQAKKTAEQILDMIDKIGEDGTKGLQLYLKTFGRDEWSIKKLDLKGGWVERICLTLVKIWKNQTFILEYGNLVVLCSLKVKLEEIYRQSTKRNNWTMRELSQEDLTEQSFLAGCPTSEELDVYNVFKMLEARQTVKNAVPA